MCNFVYNAIGLLITHKLTEKCELNVFILSSMQASDFLMTSLASPNQALPKVQKMELKNKG